MQSIPVQLTHYDRVAYVGLQSLALFQSPVRDGRQQWHGMLCLRKFETGDVVDIVINHQLVVKKAKQAEIPSWLLRRMLLNNAVSAGIGFVPIVGEKQHFLALKL